MSAIGRGATPDSAAALATAGAILHHQARIERLRDQVLGAEATASAPA